MCTVAESTSTTYAIACLPALPLYVFPKATLIVSAIPKASRLEYFIPKATFFVNADIVSKAALLQTVIYKAAWFECFVAKATLSVNTNLPTCQRPF